MCCSCSLMTSVTIRSMHWAINLFKRLTSIAWFGAVWLLPMPISWEGLRLLCVRRLGHRCLVGKLCGILKTRECGALRYLTSTGPCPRFSVRTDTPPLLREKTNQASRVILTVRSVRDLYIKALFKESFGNISRA